MNMHGRSGPCAVCAVIKHKNEKKMSEACIHILFLDIRQRRIEESFLEKKILFVPHCDCPVKRKVPRGQSDRGSHCGCTVQELCNRRHIASLSSS